MNRILLGKNALIFGAGGSIGTTVAKEFAAEGARVYLSGRSKSNVEAAAREVGRNGAGARVAVVDVSDPWAVRTYVDGIVDEAGTIDVIFNAAGPLPHLYGNGKLAVDSTVEEFFVALDQVVKPQYLPANDRQ